MARAGSQPLSAISLDELIALNDEIAALVRAGIPLDRGLLDLAPDLPDRLGQIMAALGERTARGESLSEAILAEQGHLPRLYAVVVEAGIRAGRLTAVLEKLATTARQMVELRSMAGSALLYPMIVFFLAYLLWIGFVLWTAPITAPAYESFDIKSAAWIERAAGAGSTIQYWGPAVPLLVLGAFGAWWLLSGRALIVQSGAARRRLGWIPGGRRLLRSLQAAMFADVLSLLVEANAPLDESIALAAEASGSWLIEGEAERLVARLRQGAPLEECLTEAPGFPPLLCWLVQTGQQQGALDAALRHAAETYRERARQRAEAARLLLPLLLTIGIGGGTVLAYGLLLFWPWTSLLKSLSEM